MATEIAKFFITGTLPFAPAETIEIYAVMQAAEQSRAQNGAVVHVADVVNSAK